MQKIYSDVIEFRGTHYDYGLMLGSYLKDTFILANRQKQWFSKKSYQFLIDIETYYDVIQTFAPKIWDELNGLADSLNKNIEDTVREFGGYYLEYGRSGCSIFAQVDYMIRNYDNDPLSYEGLFALYEPTDSGFATIGPTMQITGRTDGMNEKGLTMGYNFINRKQSYDGFICNMIGRIILETCETVDDAITLLKEIPHRHSFSYALLDPYHEPIIVEASPRKVSVRSDFVCTNHFEQLIEENRYRMDDSLRRQKVIKNEKQYLTDSLSAYKMMNNIDKGVFSTNYGAWSGTLHTSLFYPKQLKVGLTLGGDRLPFMFNFSAWLNGDHLKVKRINGELDTNIPFVNMVEL